MELRSGGPVVDRRSFGDAQVDGVVSDRNRWRCDALEVSPQVVRNAASDVVDNELEIA